MRIGKWSPFVPPRIAVSTAALAVSAAYVKRHLIVAFFPARAPDGMPLGLEFRILNDVCLDRFKIDLKRRQANPAIPK